MTLSEARQQGLIRLRLPVWNDRAYLEMERRDDGMYSPWAVLYDPIVEEACGYGPHRYIPTDQGSDWLPYHGATAPGDGTGDLASKSLV